MKLSDEALNRLQLEFGGPGKADQLEAARLELRRRCKDSLWFFAYHALEMKDIDTVLHHDMAERFQRRSNRRYTLWLVARGHLKTSLWTESGTLWSLINNPHRRHLIVNAKLDNAEGILHDIRQFVTTREVFRWLFPEYCIDLAPRHKQKQCRDLLDRLDMPCSNWAGRREGTIQIMSVEASLVSKHFDEMWYDKKERVWISGVCDPYQPLEAKYQLTRQCLVILALNAWPVTVQTRSPLVLRDIDILKTGKDFEVGLSVTTADDNIRKLFEPNAPPIQERIRALDELHRTGIRTFVMIAPMLPGTESLAEMLKGKVDHVILDRMNYHYADWVYRKYSLEDKLTDEYFDRTEQILSSTFAKLGISC